MKAALAAGLNKVRIPLQRVRRELCSGQFPCGGTEPFGEAGLNQSAASQVALLCPGVALEPYRGPKPPWAYEAGTYTSTLREEVERA